MNKEEGDLVTPEAPEVLAAGICQQVALQRFSEASLD